MDQSHWSATFIHCSASATTSREAECLSYSNQAGPGRSTLNDVMREARAACLILQAVSGLSDAPEDLTKIFPAFTTPDGNLKRSSITISAKTLFSTKTFSAGFLITQPQKHNHLPLKKL